MNNRGWRSRYYVVVRQQRLNFVFKFKTQYDTEAHHIQLQRQYSNSLEIKPVIKTHTF